MTQLLVRQRPAVRTIRSIAPPKLPAMLPVAVGLVAFALALYHNLCGTHICTTFFGDSRHYLDSCARITQLVLTGGNFSSLAEHLMMDGPIIPALAAPFFVLTNHVPTALDRTPFIVLGSLACGLGAAALCYLGFKMTNSRTAALITGLLWATYPAALISAGRYLTEGPTALLLIGAVVLACANKRVALGVVLGIMLLLKPVMAPAIAAVVLLSILATPTPRLRLHMVGLVAAGTMVIVGPWMMFTKSTTGEAHLTPQRAPVYNIAKGCDTDADGWGALPESRWTEILSTCDSARTVLSSAIQYRPQELVNLLSRKVLRLWSAPWNDFRANVLCLTPNGQILWQKLLWIFALPGALAVIARARGPARLIGWCSIVVIAAHCIYIPFETIARYGYSAMPFVTLLAVYGMYNAPRNRQLTALLVLITTAAMVVSTAMSPDGRDTQSVACRLEGNQIASRLVTIPQVEGIANLLIDGDVDNAIIKINGHRVETQPISIYRTMPQFYNGLNIMRVFAGKLNCPVEALRQWRSAPVSPSWLKQGEANIITISAAAGQAATIIADNDDARQQRLSLPLFNSFSGGMFCNQTDSLEGRLSNPVTFKRAPSQSSDPTKRYRMFIMLCDAAPATSTANAQPFVKEFTAGDFDPVLRNTLVPDADITINRTCLKVASSMGQRVTLPGTLPDYGLVTVRGEIKAVQRNCIASVVPIMRGKTSALVLPSTPTALKAGADWAPFEITELVPFGYLEDKAKFIDLSFYPGYWEETSEYGCVRRTGDASFRRLAVEITPASVQALSARSVRIY